MRIHVLNAGWGDSIVIELPSGRWGVVDCNCRSQSANSNATVQFLLDHHVKELDFVCLTHPDSDHFSGMQHLFECFDVREFWYFHLGRNGNLQRLYRYVDYQAEKLERDGVAPPEHHGGRHFEALLSALEKAREVRRLIAVPVQGRLDLYPRDIALDGSIPEGEVHIRAIAPHAETVTDYFNELNGCFAPDGSFINGHLPKLVHNNLSIVLLVTYGNARALLCADLESTQWELILAQYVREENPKSLEMSAVKVSHHGSKTGRCSGLWDAICPGEQVAAVITPSTQHGLPDAELLSELSSLNVQTWVTSAPSASQVLNLQQLQQHFGETIGLQLFGTLREFSRMPPSSLGICTIELRMDGTYECRGNGAATKLLH